jgi:hypothetical protein
MTCSNRVLPGELWLNPSSPMDMAREMGVELLTEEQYFELQKLGEFDLKTSSWIATPAEMRKLGGALYCDRRYGRVFVDHNSAQSYYAARQRRPTRIACAPWCSLVFICG